MAFAAVGVGVNAADSQDDGNAPVHIGSIASVLLTAALVVLAFFAYRVYHRQAEIYHRQADIMENARRGENLVKVIELLQSTEMRDNRRAVYVNLLSPNELEEDGHRAVHAPGCNSASVGVDANRRATAAVSRSRASATAASRRTSGSTPVRRS